MWSMISSLQPIVDVLAPAFTQPSAITSANFFLAWIMCLGNRTIFRVCKSANPQTLHDNSQRHGFDGYYNFFERSAWTPAGLAYRVALLIITRLKVFGPITLLVDDTLAHKRGKCVWGLGWFRDAVACAWRKWLSRRTRGSSLSWDVFNQLLKRYPLPAAVVIHSVCRPSANP